MESSGPPVYFRLRGCFEGEERTFDLTAGLYRVGSSPSSDVRLRVRGVSRQHAVLSASDTGLVVEDRGSKNGTFVDGSLVDRASVPVGSVLAFGPAELKVELPDATEAVLALTFEPASEDGGGHSVSYFSQETLSCLEQVAPEAAQSWLRLLDGFLERLFATPGGEPTAALTYLVHSLGVAGSSLVEWEDGDEPVVLASCGRLGNLTPYRDVQRREEEAFSFSTDGTLTRGVLVGDERPPLELRIWGDFAGRGESRLPLRLLLRLVDRIRRWPLRESPGEARGRRRGGPPGLVFPDGYLPGISRGMTEVYRQMRSLVEDDLPVLIVGETGVGKELLAEILHGSSDRRDGAFVALNCAAIPADLLEAELFGIGKGVATGVEARTGKFQMAAGGTLFLDEIGEMQPALQAKLLRALQEKQVQPVGGLPQSVDVRIVSATNADLESRMEQGTFRRDLYYRLAGFEVHVPPLRDCPEDLPPLIEHFLRTSAERRGVFVRGVTVKAYNRLLSYPWPGNVRELRHEIHRLVQLSTEGDVIDAAKLSHRLLASGGANLSPAAGDDLNLEAAVRDLEHRLICEALRRKDGRQMWAAELLGISRNHLAAKIKRLGINPRDFRPAPRTRKGG